MTIARTAMRAHEVITAISVWEGEMGKREAENWWPAIGPIFWMANGLGSDFVLFLLGKQRVRYLPAIHNQDICSLTPT